MRDHELWIKAGGEKQVQSFRGEKFSYNVNLHVLEGIALFMSRRHENPQTYEPTLTVYLDTTADQAFFNQMLLPANIILNNEIESWRREGKATKPQRKVWHAKVEFDDSAPAAVLSNGVFTRVTLWEKDIEDGINLGRVSREGYFHAAFSDAEIALLKRGESWLTLTVGNSFTKAMRDHQKLSVDKLTIDKQNVQPVQIDGPKFYYGRILSDDGSPPVLDPVPWPGAAQDC